MRNTVILAFLLASLATSTALAMPQGQFRVRIGGIDSGILVQSGAVQQAPAPSGAQVLGVCRYRLIWHTQSGLNPQLCLAEEERTSLYPNCSQNRLNRIPSVVRAGNNQNGGGLRCEGLDVNDTPQSVSLLIAGESAAFGGLGLLGVIQIDLFVDTFQA